MAAEFSSIALLFCMVLLSLPTISIVLLTVCRLLDSLGRPYRASIRFSCFRSDVVEDPDELEEDVEDKDEDTHLGLLDLYPLLLVLVRSFALFQSSCPYRVSIFLRPHLLVPNYFHFHSFAVSYDF